MRIRRGTPRELVYGNALVHGVPFAEKLGKVLSQERRHAISGSALHAIDQNSFRTAHYLGTTLALVLRSTKTHQRALSEWQNSMPSESEAED